MKVFWLIVAREMFWFLSHPLSFKFRNSIIVRYKEREWRISSNSYTFKLGGSLILHHVTSGAVFSVTHKVFVIFPSFFSICAPREQSRLAWRTFVSIERSHLFVYSLWVFKS